MGSRGSSGRGMASRVYGRFPTYTHFLNFGTQREASTYHEGANFSLSKWNSLTDEEQRGIHAYTGSWYDEMNTSLREGRTPGSRAQSYIDGATEALKKWRAAEDVMVFRGANYHWTANLLGGTEDQLDNPAFLRGRIGKTVTDKGFMSSGTHTDSAWGADVAYTVFVRKGVEGMYVDPVSSNRGEKEFLFNRDATFVVHQITTDSRGRIKELVLEATETKHKR